MKITARCFSCRRCTGCHSLDQDKEGRRLRGVYRRTSGSVASFTYSDGVKNAPITWGAASLDKWLTDADQFIPDANMAFRLAKSDERAGGHRLLEAAFQQVVLIAQLRIPISAWRL